MSTRDASVFALGAAVATSVVATYYAYDQIRTRLPLWRKQRDLVQEYAKAMLPPLEDMAKLEADFVKQLEGGLSKPNGSSVLMLPTHVLNLPTGDETGACFAIDIGGTNFRVMFIKLSEEHGKLEEVVGEQVAIPREVYSGNSRQLFDFLAGRLKEFIEKQRLKCPELQAGAQPIVGFCFSFAMEQLSLNSGRLMTWSKGFDVDGVIGQDVVRLLSDALARAGRPCRVLALINDSVGVLTASRYFDQATEVGFILGTGTNACIVEKVGAIAKWQPAGVPKDTLTAINTECGCYCSNLLPRVQEDLDLDDACVPGLRGKMLVEKCMSGLYLGECARRILLSFALRVQLLGPVLPPQLQQPGQFTTAHLAALESDTSPLRRTVARVLTEALGVAPGTLGLESLVMVQQVCRLVVRRSARLAATMLLGILRQQGWRAAPRRVVVAVDGGVFLKYHNWRRFLDESILEALGPEAQLIQFRPTADGSSYGAAILAAAAARCS